MEKLCLFFILAIFASQAMGMSFRQKRQTNTKDDIEDRYGWENRRPLFPGSLFPGQGQFPGQIQFPGQGQFPNQGQFPAQRQQQQQQTTTPSPTGSTTISPDIQNCIRTCPVTSEFNPVCGTDGLQYSNPGRLGCAQGCGRNVSLFRSAPCPPTTTAAPS